MEDEWVDVTALPLIADERWLHVQNGGGTAQDIPKPFEGLTHSEVLALEFAPERMLVDDLIPMGAVGTVAGVPETYKSWQAQRIAVMVGSGEGELFGKPVGHSGPVGYFWQDDSTREEAERIKLYEKARGSDTTPDVRWFLNEGLRLPDDLGKLRITITHFEFCLVVLDSLYNVLFGMDLKDEGAERVIAELKSEVCDVTGCTVLIVDHMPWATDSNRGRLRAYGGVFKNAATRFGIYIDADKNKLWVEARGNNITGFKRTPAEWDSEALELRLIDTHDVVSEEEYEQRILDHLAENRDQTTAQMDAIKGGKQALLAARARLLASGSIESYKGGTSGRKVYWNLSSGAGSTGSAESLNLLEGVEPVSTGSPVQPVHPYGVNVGVEPVEPDRETNADDDIPF